MFMFNKILFSRALDSRFLLPVVSSPQTKNIVRSLMLGKSELTADPVSGEPKKVLIVSFYNPKL